MHAFGSYTTSSLLPHIQCFAHSMSSSPGNASSNGCSTHRSRRIAEFALLTKKFSSCMRIERLGKIRSKSCDSENFETGCPRWPPNTMAVLESRKGATSLSSHPSSVGMACADSIATNRPLAASIPTFNAWPKVKSSGRTRTSRAPAADPISIVRSVVALGRKLREDKKLKVRQPLSLNTTTSV